VKETHRERARRIVNRRRLIQWSILSVVVLVLGLGWWIPWLGFAVPLVMLLGVSVSLRNGRYVCGNLCPRGAFYDRILAPVARRRSIPRWVRSALFRWLLFLGLMGFMVYRVSLNPADPLHWGRVFWMMCLVTTAIGIPLALLVHPRMWCSVCPIGTVQAALGGRRRRLRIDPTRCRTCGLCEHACPMGLSIIEHRHQGMVPHTDCLRCSECVAVCPTSALAWPEEAS